MTDQYAVSFLKSPAAHKLGFALSRVIVPGWVLTGAMFKLVQRTPSNLPQHFFVAPARDAEIDLGVLLHTLIGLEFFAIAIMVLVPKLAREMAIFMLSSFVIILSFELFKGATSCGCLGSVKVPPGVMLGVDGVLLLGVILFRPAMREVPMMGGRVLAALGVTVVGFAISFGMMQSSEPAAPTVENNQTANGSSGAMPAPTPGPVIDPNDCSLDPQQIAHPTFWYAKDLEGWPDQCWNQISLFQLLRAWPADIAQGRKHIVFYRRDCDHCEEMFHTYLGGQITTPVIAYSIPSDNLWNMPQTSATLMEMPTGVDWIIETPLVITLQDGKVVAAAEGTGFETLFEE